MSDALLLNMLLCDRRLRRTVLPAAIVLAMTWASSLAAGPDSGTPSGKDTPAAPGQASAQTPAGPQSGTGAQSGRGAEPAPGGASATLPPGVFVRINGIDIPRARFVDELNDVLGDSYKETFISHVLVDEKAKAAGVTTTESEIDSHVQSSVDQVLRERFGGDAAKMEAALRERGMTAQGWKRRLRIEGRYDLLLEKLIRQDRKVSDDTLKRLFEEKYGPSGVQIKIRHILKNVPVATSPDYTIQQFEKEKEKIDREARSLAEDALRKLQAGKTFEEVMADVSDDPRKISGGVMTAWKGRYGADLDEIASKLRKGDRSGVIKGPDGYRIVECTDVIENEEVHATHILVAAGGRAQSRSDEEARKKAEDLLAKIKAGGNFEQLAKENSEDPGSASRGGDLGFFGRRAMVKPFEDAVFAMEPGQVSDLVKTNFGYHIIKVLEKRKSQDRTLRQISVSTQFSSVKDRRLRPALEAKARSELDSLKAQLGKPGSTFAELASTHSDDLVTKADGGLIKSYRDGMYGGDVDEAIKALRPGDPPRIAKDAAGHLHLLVVDEVVKTELSQVRGALEQEELQRPASPQEKNEYLAKLREAATIL